MRAQFRRDAAEISVRGAVTFTVTAIVLAAGAELNDLLHGFLTGDPRAS
jgi:hypothetical protein